MRLQRCFAALAIWLGAASAGSITFQGLITQSTSDGTGPAMNNPSLNNIADGDSFLVELDLGAPITSPGSFSTGAGTLFFTDAAAGASEIDFGPASLTVSPDGMSADFSLLGCLTTGSGCLVGNMLAVNFQIPAGMLADQNVPASTISGLSPALDLLEDDGTTDIQGTVTGFSNVPEPSAALPLFLILATIAVGNSQRSKR